MDRRDDELDGGQSDDRHEGTKSTTASLQAHCDRLVPMTRLYISTERGKSTGGRYTPSPNDQEVEMGTRESRASARQSRASGRESHGKGNEAARVEDKRAGKHMVKGRACSHGNGVQGIQKGGVQDRKGSERGNWNFREGQKGGAGPQTVTHSHKTGSHSPTL
ncbi:hypothetical protein L227DRAFT_568677 [Lentinus tigrinus ALCF2SS1-6]|uniref:Uncharacterized protein n=1 Tax=Lentinus tigrinus ALCF2SS1-6 TaxID=1328759 RepID=A0A5C2RL79_9APHY|nr:hypothetical protein L227DRAFT_568677 [Lentinus tigrinus ALCF2SS1-6]